MMNVFSSIWNGIVSALNWLLQGLYGITGNYGVAIILLTVIVKLILLPLTIKQTRSMIAMQKIQPEIKKLQEKYKDDKERLSQEMMKFYKENKVNPLGGCLPLILQLPVFIALFTVLRKYLMTPPTMIVGNTFAVFRGVGQFTGIATYSIAGGAAGALPYIKPASFLWINNLADTTRTADPYFILVILLMVTTWYSQKQVMTDPRQKTMMYIMPLLMGFLAMSFPAGVILYWVTTNALQILQQFGMELYDKKRPKELPKEKAKEEKKPLPERAPVKGQLLDKARESAKGKTPAKQAPGAKTKAPTKPPPGGKPKAPTKPAPSAKPKPKSTGQKGQPGGKKQASGGKGGKASQVRKPKGPPPQQGRSPQGGSKRNPKGKK